MLKTASGTTKQGTTSDFEGSYILSLKNIAPGDSLVVSTVGYLPKAYELERGRSTLTINYKLERTSFNLSEVVVLAGENPAHIILDKVDKNRKQNNPERLSSYSYEVYNKIEIDLYDISPKLQNNRLLKPFDFIFDNVDSTSEEKPFLPLFLTESLSDYYYRKDPKAEKEIIKATKVSGLENESVNQFLGKMYLNFNIYDNWIPILGQNFASPISGSGKTFYKYDLVDSAFIEGKWCYKIIFRPKRKTENTFDGDIWISDSSFAVAQVSMQIAAHSNVNFVNRLSIFQSFTNVDNQLWMLKKDKFIADFVAPGDAPGIIGRKTTSFNNFDIMVANIDTFFEENRNILVTEGANINDETFWKDARHDKLEKNEAAIYALVDSIQNVPIYKTYVDIIQTLFTGYKIWGNIEIGPYFTFISSNDVEGLRLKGGFRTSNQFSTKWMFGGYLAYGFRDKDFKYALETFIFLDKNPRQAIGARYKDDLNLSSTHIDEFGYDNIFAGIFRRNIPMRLVRIELYELYHVKEWDAGLSMQTHINKKNLDPYEFSEFTFNFPSENSDFAEVDRTGDVNATEVGIKFRYAYQEKFISGEFDRISLGSKYPVLELRFNYGVKDLFNSDFGYQKIELGLDDKITINPFGELHFNLSGGKIFNTLPYLLLETFSANETYYYLPNYFSNMRRYEFISDTYGKLFLSHHFRGFILDRIPLLKKLKWRSLITAKGIIGTLSEANKSANRLNNIISPFPKPYLEAGAGIENIFRVFRIDAVWRLNYYDLPNANKFGIRASMQFEF